MRALHEFSPGEWIALRPLRDGLRQLRNDALLAAYLRRRVPGQDEFVRTQRSATPVPTPLAVVIAFEQPWALDWLLASAAANLRGMRCLVFDNSRSSQARAALAQVCNDRGVPYLALPPWRTRHPNRSHGLAMSWVHANVLRLLQPPVFGFIDHDLVPVAPVDVPARMDGQAAYGLLNPGLAGAWNLWAGYCFFRGDAVAGRKLNFLYDFSRGVDTGGRNWQAIYRRLDRSRLRLAPREVLRLGLPGTDPDREVECIDASWVHIGGIGYGDNFERKFAYFDALRTQLESRDWATLRGQAQAIECVQWR